MENNEAKETMQFVMFFVGGIDYRHREDFIPFNV